MSEPQYPPAFTFICSTFLSAVLFVNKEIELLRLAEKFVPSPLTEEVLPKPKPVKVIQHSADEISRVKGSDSHDPPPLTPQRAQLAFYRPFVPDPMEETTIAQPDRATASFHDATEISRGQQATYSTLERPKAKNAQVMYTRPGFDNVPSY